MTDIKIAIKDNNAVLLRPANLIAGTKGQTCTLYFDENWKNYNEKYIVYKVGTNILGRYKIESNTVTIPAKVFMLSDLPLEIGFVAKSNDKTIPTSWCLIGKINEGAVIHGGSNKPSDDDDNTHIIYDGGVIA